MQARSSSLTVGANGEKNKQFVDKSKQNDFIKNISQKQLVQLARECIEKSNSNAIKLSDLFDPQYNLLHHDIKQERYRDFLLYGGRGSIKSSFISLEIMLGLIRDENACAVVYRKFLNTVELTVYEQMQWAVFVLGVGEEWCFVKTAHRAINQRTGQVIIFKGLDTVGKVKSIKAPKNKYWKFLWFEEADQFRDAAELRNVKQSVFRGYNGNTMTFYSWNPPRLLQHWIYEFANGKMDARKHFSCYLAVKNREWLGKTFYEEAEELKRTNPTAYQHEYLGEGTGTDGLVFGMFRRKTHVIESLNKGEKILRTIFAIDPATENDATAGVPVHITSLGRAVVGKVFYYDPTASGCSPLAPSAQVSLINRWLKGLKGTRWAFDLSKTFIIFDPAGAPLRREMSYQTGLKTQIIKKTAIIESVWALQDLWENGTLYILEDFNYRCPLTGKPSRLNPLIRELETLSWGTDDDRKKKSGVIPEGQKQDCIDALRYATHYFTNPQLTHQFEYAQKLIVNG